MELEQIFNTTEEEKQNKMVSFSYYDQNHILGMFSDISMAILKETIISKQPDNYKSKMEFLAKNLTFFSAKLIYPLIYVYIP